MFCFFFTLSILNDSGVALLTKRIKHNINSDYINSVVWML